MAKPAPVSAGLLGSNVQTIGLQPIPSLAIKNLKDTKKAIGGGDISIVGGSALLPDAGPMGTAADVEEPTSDQISIYVVRAGDTISEIAKMYDVTTNTILWANDLTSKSALKEGQVLVILPVSGVRHTVAKGETVESLAKKYKGDAKDIIQYNNLTEKTLAVGDLVIIPNGEEPIITRTSGSSSGKAGGSKVRGSNSPNYPGYYIRPLAGGTKTQGLHGYNAVDIAGQLNTPILAAASGQVIIAKTLGWNGGYAKYVVIQHGNNSQTLYAHLNGLNVNVGQHVEQGEVIGYMGSTGNSTGVHLHFEIRGAKNPF